MLGQVKPIHSVSIEGRAGWAEWKVRTRRLPHRGSQLEASGAPECRLEIFYAYATSDICLREELRRFLSTGRISRESSRGVSATDEGQRLTSNRVSGEILKRQRVREKPKRQAGSYKPLISSALTPSLDFTLCQNSAVRFAICIQPGKAVKIDWHYCLLLRRRHFELQVDHRTTISSFPCRLYSRGTHCMKHTHYGS